MPVPGLYAALFPPAMAAGSAETNAGVGSPMSHNELAFVHGWAYSRPRGVTDPVELARRVATASSVFSDRPWREQLARWDDQVKPATRREHLRLARVPVGTLVDADAAAYLATCCRWLTAMVTQHHRHNSSAVVPVSDFVAHAVEWTGLPATAVAPVLGGWSAVSRGDSDLLRSAATAVRATPSVRAALFQEADASESLARLRRDAPDAVRDWTELAAVRQVGGFDTGGPCGGELPEVVLRQLRTAVDEDTDARTRAARVAADSVAREIRSQVPKAERAAFDDLLTEARLVYRLRDERGVESDVAAAGLLRTAVLRVGARLAQEGRLRRPEDMLEATPDELARLPVCDPIAAPLADRAERRAAATSFTPPSSIGDDSLPLPTADPASLAPFRRLIAARNVTVAGMWAIGADRPLTEAATGVVGVAAHPGVVEGRARLVLQPSDLTSVEPGDVLVTVSTTEAACAVAGMLSAVVTDQGGFTSHAAIVARECGIPAVVGCGNATSRIPDGAKVRVDGTAGVVTLLG